jgi:flagellar hook-length control protein FliK
MEILATLAAPPAVPSPAGGPGVDDPFLALLAGLLQAPMPSPPVPPAATAASPADAGAAAPAPGVGLPPEPAKSPLPHQPVEPLGGALTVLGLDPPAVEPAPLPSASGIEPARGGEPPDPVVPTVAPAPAIAALAVAPTIDPHAAPKRSTRTDDGTPQPAPASPAAVPRGDPSDTAGIAGAAPVLVEAVPAARVQVGGEAGATLQADRDAPETAADDGPVPGAASGDRPPAAVAATLSGDPGAPSGISGSKPADAPRPLPGPGVHLPTPDHLGRQVSARLEVIDGAAGSRVRIDLEPADLGRVEVSLRLDEAGTAAATFTVDRPETLALLQRDSRTVGELLGAAGFTVDQGGLDFSLRYSGHQDGGSGRRPSGRGDTDGRRSLNGAAAGETAPLRRRGLLDLRV